MSNFFFMFIPAHRRSSHVPIPLIFLCELLIMGSCLKTGINPSSSEHLPVDTVFEFPSPLPVWPAGDDFASGLIDLGGLQVRQIWSFNKVSAMHTGGPDNLGATFFEPSPIPDGFSLLGSYAQSSNKPLFGCVLVGKGNTDASDQSGNIILKPPIDYTLVWSTDTESNETKDYTYFWLPTPPDGYKAVGYVITNSSGKPSLDQIRCVRSDFTDESETDSWVWGKTTEESDNGLNIYGLRPKSRGSKAQQLGVGTFVITTNSTTTNQSSPLPLSCLKNKNFESSSTTPNLNQLEALFQTYSPYIYFHPHELYLPSSVNWYFSNGALLYNKDNESNPISIEPNGLNLPQGGSSDGSYWLDLPIAEDAKETVKRGDLHSAEVYLHFKSVLGATCTDIQVWLFYPFNGPATAKLGIIEEIPLGKIGEHVGDWEHVTLRISNFNGFLQRVYFAQHSGGTWVDSSLLEFQKGNKFVGYSSRNGHASYYEEGSNLQGASEAGLRNDTNKSRLVLDTGEKFSVVEADGLSTVAPPWLNYDREWGPKIAYELEKEVEIIEKLVPENMKAAFERLVNSLPSEIYGEEGPVGPKMKSSWNGDED